ncbi:polymorphic toxin-type HINT domain-containing protein [Streptomyces decoyicus]|uniref:polymorphic toxin-type HINT domain-containing protein n=1 Tax=Streptomyces decoyicus TaxID=249567 RepID=UPI0037F7E42B
MKKKRESEVAEARRKAEEARKEQEKQKAAKKLHCVSHTGNEIAGLLPCVLSGGDVTPVIDPTLTAVVWEITGLNDLRECIKNPAFGACTAFAISVLPIGKVKLLKKLGEGIEDIAESSRVAKKAKCFKCFLAGTKVLMADRSTKNIESVRVGDKVMATDPVSGHTGKRTVTDLIATEHDKNFNELTITTPQGNRRLTATNEHPFWSPSKNAWTEAAHLRPGMTLRTVDGSAVTVKGNRPFSQNARTYNLTVDNLHTYYVLAGETPVLVHNSNCPKLSDPNPIINKQLRWEYEEVLAGRGTPRPGNGPGGLDIYQAEGLSARQQAQWKGAVIYDATGTNHRVLKRPDGLIGFVWKHDYTKPRLFPSPWYKDGGEVPNLKP